MRNEEIIKQFMWGLSILNSYIEFNGKLNLQDINIFSEDFMCDVINILFDLELVNANNGRRNNQDYDLISERHKYIVQVSSTKETKKIIETLSSLDRRIKSRKENEKKLSLIKAKKHRDIASYTSDMQVEERILEKELSENNITNYRVIFMILTNDAIKQRLYKGNEKRGYIVPNDIRFNQDNDIWDFETLINKLKSISENESAEDIFYKLEIFMKKHNDIFVKRAVFDIQKDKVSRIINEYADNFTEKLFRHRYIEDSNVKLCNIYVDPIFQIEGIIRTQNIVEILDSFLWDNPMCRVLFVEGDAAVGKTSWVSWLCYHYLELDEIGKSIFLERRIICIRLRELDFSGDNKSVEKCILEYLGIESLDVFNKNYSNCIMILDGADEISMVRNLLHTTIEEFIINVRKIFSNNKIIITSRPKFIDKKIFNSRNYTVKNIEILHYDYEKRMEWIEKYEACGEGIAETTKRYIKSIDEKVVSGVADTPLALYLLAACDMKEEFQDNAWALYNEIFKNAIINTEYNENFSFTVPHHPIKRNKQVIYDIVCDIAFRMFQNSSEERYYITGQEVESIIAQRELDEVESQWAKHCCVLCAYWKSGTNIGALEFYHNNIRDYFFCEYIFEELNKCCKNMNLFDIDEKKFLETMCKIMYYGSVSGTTWEQTFSFIFLRLKYELKYKEDGERSFFSNIDFEDSVPKMFCEMLLYKKIVWQYDYKKPIYQAVKNTIFNTLLLLRVCQEASDLVKDNDHVISLWRKENEGRDINSMGVLREWSEIFCGEVKINDEQSVGIGKNCVLDYLNLDNIFGEKVNFSYSHLNLTSIRNSNLKNVVLRYAELRDTNFEGADLREADFSNAKLINTVFTNANIKGAIFKGATLEGVVFSGVELKGADFTDATIINIDWSMQNLAEVRLEGVRFINCNLKRIKKKRSHLDRVEFIKCDLEKCDLENSALENIVFSESVLNKSNLVGTNLVDCYFQNLDIVDANVRNATLIGTSFENIDFTDTAFSQADIIDCYFKGNCKFQRTDFRKTKVGMKVLDNLKNQGADVRFINKVNRE